MHSSLLPGGTNRSSTMSIQPVLQSCQNALHANDSVVLGPYGAEPAFATHQPRAGGRRS